MPYCHSCDDRQEERRRLQRRFSELRKADRSIEGNLKDRHPEMKPEWVIQVMEDPYEYEVATSLRGERRTIMYGRVPEYGQWLSVVFIGDIGNDGVDNLVLLTAYPDKRLEKKYGGRPWSIR